MNLGRTFAVGLLAVLLTATLVTATVVAAAHLTVLDPAFVTDTIEEEDGYAAMEESMRTGMAPDDGAERERAGDASDDPVDPSGPAPRSRPSSSAG